MAGKTSARGDKRCSNLFGFGPICLHFSPGRQPPDLSESSFVDNMHQTGPHPEPKTETARNQGEEIKRVKRIHTMTQRDSCLRAILTIFPKRKRQDAPNQYFLISRNPPF